MFNNVLIANRGEIAVRIIRAARELGLVTYAIYSPVDKNALHVKLADHSIPLQENDGEIGYLDIKQLIEICLANNIQSVHPGYGFLSESEIFAQALLEKDITFIGPSPKVIKLLGNKVQSRAVARSIGLSVPDGSDIITSKEEGIAFAQEIGYPVLVKAVYGGGGMGIIAAKNEQELVKALQSASAQAQSVFGRGEVYIENYIDRPRHIEFQILADNYGNVVHLGERECSIQRRNQKLLEEAPSTALSAEERKEIGTLVCNLAAEVGYTNAGTVEFLYKDNEMLFNEVNPRIQVEHPVTEMITGKDLVKEQIKIAQGKRLAFRQNDVFFRGHAMELRINAEDPLKNFQPTPGLVNKFTLPGGPNIRFDTALFEGFTVPNNYDSLLGKLIVASETRKETIQRAKHALQELTITGFPTNIPFFEVLLENKRFRQGRLNIKFIQEEAILNEVKRKTYIKASALFVVGLQKNRYNLPEQSDKWRSKSKLEAIGRE
jgi:acetyl-CoA carboxylase biotin carboxylase subunit